MSQKHPEKQQLAATMGKALRDHLGKGPKTVHVEVSPSYLTMHIKGAMTPQEQLLLAQHEAPAARELRASLMPDVTAAIHAEVEALLQTTILEWYWDWHLEAHTGMVWAALASPEPGPQQWPSHLNQRVFERKIHRISARAQQAPEAIHTCWLNHRIILIERTTGFPTTEKIFLARGLRDPLKQAKQQVEQQLFYEERMEVILGRKIIEIFADWDWERGLGYTLLMLQQEKKPRFTS